jgi:hypothetical protein
MDTRFCSIKNEKRAGKKLLLIKSKWDNWIQAENLEQNIYPFL